MSDILGARVGSDDPGQIAAVRKSAPEVLAVGAKPKASAKQAPRAGAIYDERGYLKGREPRTMSPDELLAMGHKPMSPLQALRAHCLDCCAGSAQQVDNCMALRCPSWPYRMGTNPFRKRPSEEQQQAMRERGRRLAEANKSRPPGAEHHDTGTAILPVERA